MDERESICLRCFHSYVCEQFNEHRDVKNDKCHFYNDHFVPYADVAPAQKWISAKESLPRDGDCVLVIASGKCENITLENAIEIATFDMSEGWILEMWPEWENPKVTYWMQLPEAPKEDHDGK